MTMAQADADCNQAIIADAVVTAQTLKACNTANVPTSYPCSHGSRVYEAYIPTAWPLDERQRLGQSAAIPATPHQAVCTVTA